MCKLSSAGCKNCGNCMKNAAMAKTAKTVNQLMISRTNKDLKPQAASTS